jgi:hypothetical protein
MQHSADLKQIQRGEVFDLCRQFVQNEPSLGDDITTTVPPWAELSPFTQVFLSRASRSSKN